MNCGKGRALFQFGSSRKILFKEVRLICAEQRSQPRQDLKEDYKAEGAVNVKTLK